MKKQTLIAALGLILAIITIVSSSTTTFAANNNPMRFELNSDFYVGNKKLSAGTYEIQQTSDQLFLIRNVETKVSVLISARAQAGEGDNVKTEKVVLYRYGQQVFLREIYNYRNNTGKLLVESKSERRVKEQINGSRKHIAEKNVKPEIIEVAMNNRLNQ